MKPMKGWPNKHCVGGEDVNCNAVEYYCQSNLGEGGGGGGTIHMDKLIGVVC